MEKLNNSGKILLSPFGNFRLDLLHYPLKRSGLLVSRIDEIIKFLKVYFFHLLSHCLLDLFDDIPHLHFINTTIINNYEQIIINNGGYARSLFYPFAKINAFIRFEVAMQYCICWIVPNTFTAAWPKDLWRRLSHQLFSLSWTKKVNV